MSLKTTKTRVAVFKYLSHDFECIFTADMESATDLIRVSDYVEVLFTPRAEEEIVPAILAGLDKEADAIRNEAMQKLNRIAEQKAEILQITFMPSDEL